MKFLCLLYLTRGVYKAHRGNKVNSALIFVLIDAVFDKTWLKSPLNAVRNRRLVEGAFLRSYLVSCIEWGNCGYRLEFLESN